MFAKIPLHAAASCCPLSSDMVEENYGKYVHADAYTRKRVPLWFTPENVL